MDSPEHVWRKLNTSFASFGGMPSAGCKLFSSFEFGSHVLVLNNRDFLQKTSNHIPYLVPFVLNLGSNLFTQIMQ